MNGSNLLATSMLLRKRTRIKYIKDVFSNTLMKITRAWKFRLYPTKAQAKEMQTSLWFSKNLWNDGLEFAKQLYTDFQKFPTRNTYQEISKNSGLYSQVAQDVFMRLDLAIKAKLRRKKAGLKGGFPRFKSIDRVKSLHYPQSGFSLIGKKLKVTPFGEISIKKHREIEGKIKTLTLKKESTGKWYAILTAETDAKPVPKNNGSEVGIDLGLINFIVLSDGTAIKNPRHLKKHQDNLRAKQKPLSRAKRGSSNRKKTKKRLAVIHEKIKNIRRDFLHKLSRKLVNSHSLIALEDLASQKMAEKAHGKSINDAGWSEFIGMLSYKAEGAGSRLKLVNPENTTKECSRCGILTDKELSERQHNCPSCGLSMDRDLNAAINILNRATVGTTGSSACEDEASTVRQVSSMKQEAQGFSPG
jgi:putative transposase